jgi:hypothetical protein
MAYILSLDNLRDEAVTMMLVKVLHEEPRYPK